MPNTVAPGRPCAYGSVRSADVRAREHRGDPGRSACRSITRRRRFDRRCTDQVVAERLRIAAIVAERAHRALLDVDRRSAVDGADPDAAGVVLDQRHAPCRCRDCRPGGIVTERLPTCRCFRSARSSATGRRTCRTTRCRRAATSTRARRHRARPFSSSSPSGRIVAARRDGSNSASRDWSRPTTCRRRSRRAPSRAARRCAPLRGWSARARAPTRRSGCFDGTAANALATISSKYSNARRRIVTLESVAIGAEPELRRRRLRGSRARCVIWLTRRRGIHHVAEMRAVRIGASQRRPDRRRPRAGRNDRSEDASRSRQAASPGIADLVMQRLRNCTSAGS